MIDRDTPASGSVALVLAIGVVAALNIITCALMVAAFHVDPPELSANGTQLLTGWGGGIIGVLGSYIGFTFGQRKSNGTTPPAAEPPAEAEPYQPMGGQQ